MVIPDSKPPRVTVVIPMWNEERYIAKCLDSLLANDYPTDLLEIIVVDGGSTDRSRDIVLGYCRRYPFIRLLDNPKRIMSAALNIGIREATGDIIVRMDAHAVYAPDYIRQCVDLLCTSGAANVGGVQRAVGENYISRAIALAINNPFGTGDAYFRHAEKEMWVDTVYLGAWWKATLNRLGGFREDLAVNEDYELNVRLREARLDPSAGPFHEELVTHQGFAPNDRLRRARGRILLSPRIRCWYYVRPSLAALARQYFRYGFWKVRTLVLHPESVRWRQLAPPALVIGFIGSGVAGMLHPMLWLPLPGVYLAAVLLVSTYLAVRRGLIYAPVLPLVFVTIHLSWGLGFIAGLMKWGIPKFSLRAVIKAFAPPYAE